MFHRSSLIASYEAPRYLCWQPHPWYHGFLMSRIVWEIKANIVIWFLSLFNAEMAQVVNPLSGTTHNCVLFVFDSPLSVAGPSVARHELSDQTNVKASELYNGRRCEYMTNSVRTSVIFLSLSYTVVYFTLKCIFRPVCIPLTWFIPG